MGDLKVISYKEERVLTTSQLAEAYGTESKRIQNNFNENRARFSEGKHFILLASQERMEFKNDSRNSGLVQKQAIPGKCHFHERGGYRELYIF
ncbi:ORF6N domain-containing protein [Brevibacillus reuszeri]|uniref:ORF6N domain-containing protein n=1 Tax=Brevibacillus reuszeri TaxID=54915 RepID=UPI00289FD675|nr:ORF6N domain-containing protein [Brevibacillus reuszeri]